MIYDVIDINHNNDITSYGGLYNQDGVRRMILKVTQGTTFVDPLFAYRVPRMLEVGLQLGGYHFMTADNPLDQADFFLTQVVKNGQGMVKSLAMDLEMNQGSHPLSRWARRSSANWRRASAIYPSIT
jgi:lysozyme